MAATPGAIAYRVDHGTPTSLPFTPRLPTLCASPLVTGTSRATMPARRGARRALVSTSTTCAAWRLFQSNRRRSSCQRRPDRTPPMWLAARMGGSIAVTLANAGSACATAGQNRRASSRRYFAPAQRRENCGLRTSAACTLRKTAGRVGGASPAMRGPRSIFVALPWSAEGGLRDAPNDDQDTCGNATRGALEDLGSECD